MIGEEINHITECIILFKSSVCFHEKRKLLPCKHFGRQADNIHNDIFLQIYAMRTLVTPSYVGIS